MTWPRDDAPTRAAVVAVCRRLWDRGLVAGQDGNVSVRVAGDRLLVTPAGFSKTDLTAEALATVALDGTVVGGAHPPSSELAVHLAAYRHRGDVGAVVHAHPPTATAFAVAGETLPSTVLAEITVLLGPVPLVPYATPGTPGVAERFAPWWDGHDAFLMANHGALTLGADLRAAHQRMESLEHAARILWGARVLGRVGGLAPADVAALVALRPPARPADPAA